MLWTPSLRSVGRPTCSLTVVSWLWTSAGEKVPLHLFPSRRWTWKLCRRASTWNYTRTTSWNGLRTQRLCTRRGRADTACPVIQCLQYHTEDVPLEACSVLGMEFDSLVVVSKRRMLWQCRASWTRLSLSPQCAVTHRSTVSSGLLPPQCTTENPFFRSTKLLLLLSTPLF